MFEIKSDGFIKLSAFLMQKTTLKYGEVSSLIKNKDIKVNGKRVKEDIKLASSDIVTVYADKEKLKNDLVDIIFSDDNILVCVKPRGVNSDDFFSKVKGENELYYIHRLDLNTDGVMIFAKNKTAENELLLGFKNRTFIKKYLAVVLGTFKTCEGVLSDYLIKNSSVNSVEIYKDKKPNSLTVKTGYKTLVKGDTTSLLEVELFTGRTHQIRAHLAFYNHPIIGDGKYGNKDINNKLKVKNQLLTAYFLELKFDKDSPLFYLNDKIFTYQKDYKKFVI